MSDLSMTAYFIVVMLVVGAIAIFAPEHQANPAATKPSPIVHASESQPCPKRVLIGSYTWELVAGDPGEDLAGSTNFERQVIIIDPVMPSDRKHEVLLHEISHVALWESLGRTGDYFKPHLYRDEQFIEATAPILTATLRHYPELLTCELK